MRAKSGKFMGISAALLVAGMAVSGMAGSAGAESRTVNVAGSFNTPTFSGPGCSSPVGLCFSGTFSGSLEGTGSGSVNSITPTAQAGVALGDANAVIHTERGDLTCAHEQVLLNGTPGADGEFAFLCEITSGTGHYAGATGYLRGVGLAPAGTNKDTGFYLGRITLP